MMSLLWIIPSVLVAAVAFYYQHTHPRIENQNAVYVIGDLHGDVECARHWVNKTNLVSGKKWVDPSSSLVFLGDYIDKGPTSRQTV